jgi:hypothetical protein
MKKIFLLLSLIFIGSMSFSQNLSRVTITESGNIEKLSFGLRENVLLNISKEGNIIDWGIERYAGQTFERNPGRLDPYQGRVEYYNESENEAFRGKVKSIGGIIITYYASFDMETMAGKVKSVGPNKFEYYQKFENDAYKGNIKTAGTTNFTWYSSYDNAAFSGKPKSIGQSAIGYYTNMDDVAFRGKIKNIGTSNYSYYSSVDQKEFRGRLRNGNNLQVINGVKFQITN